MESTKKVAKVAKIFYCEKCDYKCSKKFNFDKHLETEKHKRATNQSCINNDVAKVAEPKLDVQSVKKYICDICEKEYKRIEHKVSKDEIIAIMISSVDLHYN